MAGGRWQVAGGRWQVAGGRWQVAGGRINLPSFLFVKIKNRIFFNLLIFILFFQDFIFLGTKNFFVPVDSASARTGQFPFPQKPARHEREGGPW